ncbi:hypothetical protein F2P81_026246 [Scophthalmus maximus]|uniref:Uncharacterized protein n=1 Tax=Scophthalmus maximus TaxID=52904 RepID=A0A6A4RQE3_SCOMX|nr:hypothetical protein F2P81_026246 [Scophthalmus maximus]
MRRYSISAIQCVWRREISRRCARGGVSGPFLSVLPAIEVFGMFPARGRWEKNLSALHICQPEVNEAKASWLAVQTECSPEVQAFTTEQGFGFRLTRAPISGRVADSIPNDELLISC